MRHRTHHGLSFILGVLLSTIISEVLRNYLPFIASLITRLAWMIKDWFSLRIDQGVVELILITFFVVLLYGYVREIAERSRVERRE